MQAAYRQAASRVAVTWNTLQRQQKLAGLGTFGDRRWRRPDSGHDGGGGHPTARTDVARPKRVSAEAASEVRALQAALKQAETQVKVTQSPVQPRGSPPERGIVSRQDWEQAQADHQRPRPTWRPLGRSRRGAGEGRHGESEPPGRAGAVSRRQEARPDRRPGAGPRRGGLPGRLRHPQGDRRSGGGLATGAARPARGGGERSAARRNPRRRERADDLGAAGGPGDGATVTQGETVTPDKPLFTVVNLRTVWVQLTCIRKTCRRSMSGRARTPPVAAALTRSKCRRVQSLLSFSHGATLRT